MKTVKIFLLSIILSATFVGCNNASDKNDDTLNQGDSLSGANAVLSRDSMEASFIAVINEIDRNLDLIRSREGVIILGPNTNMDPNLSPNDKIMRNIQMINGLLESNNERINELEVLMQEKNSTNTELKRILESRKSEYAAMYKDNERLKIQLKNKDFMIDDLNKRLSDAEVQQEILNWMIDDLDSELNTAFYVVGTFKELKDHDLAEKNGGVLGLGRTKSLDEDFDQSYFSKIDTRLTQYIPIYGKKADLLSKHATGSYSFEQEEDVITRLNITDPDKFWKANKFLVIEITI